MFMSEGKSVNFFSHVFSAIKVKESYMTLVKGSDESSLTLSFLEAS